MSNPPVGKHTLLDMTDCQCDPAIYSYWASAVLEVHKISQHFTVLNTQWHQFSPTGWSANVLLQESHLSFHTWAELAAVTADLYTCGNAMPEAAVQAVLQLFKPKKAVRVDIIRGMTVPNFKVETLGVSNELLSYAKRIL